MHIFIPHSLYLFIYQTMDTSGGVFIFGFVLAIVKKTAMYMRVKIHLQSCDLIFFSKSTSGIAGSEGSHSCNFFEEPPYIFLQGMEVQFTFPSTNTAILCRGITTYLSSEH